MNIRCLLFGHKEFKLDAFREGKLPWSVHSHPILGTQPLLRIKLCSRQGCKAVFWEACNPEDKAK